jgi:asparagine synthase (glutamine-hydrolysing)
MSDEAGRFWLSFNGEIYNSPELRSYCESRGHRFRSRMDGEVILHLWEMEGPAALQRLNGIFSLAVGDNTTGELFLARDRYGVKPLFYCEDGPSVSFASQLNALEAGGAPLGGPDVVGLAQFLTFLWIPDPQTPFANGKSLMPGHLYHWDRGVGEVRRFVDESLDGEIDVKEAREEFGDRFVAAARRQLLADVPIRLMASGGLDSSLLWWATQDAVTEAFCIEWAGDDRGEGLNEDAEAVREIQAAFGTSVEFLDGTKSETTMLPLSGDLFADPAYDLTRLIARTTAARGGKVLLSGQGADELLGGYRRHLIAPWLARGRKGARVIAGSIAARLRDKSIRSEYVARMARAFAAPSAFAAYMRLCSYSSARERAEMLGCDEVEVSDDVVWRQHRAVFDRQPETASFRRRVMAVDRDVYLPGLGLAYADRAGMEFGVEVRVPWLDLEFASWAARIPEHATVRGRSGKILSRDLAKRELPALIGTRRKRGFAAPAASVQPSDTTAGSLGFRQGSYFARAAQMAQAFMGEERGGAIAAWQKAT